MKVKELIEKLSAMDPELDVGVYNSSRDCNHSLWKVEIVKDKSWEVPNDLIVQLNTGE